MLEQQWNIKDFVINASVGVLRNIIRMYLNMYLLRVRYIFGATLKNILHGSLAAEHLNTDYVDASIRFRIDVRFFRFDVK